MSLSDDLVKLDSACKVVVSAIERQGKEIHQLRYDSKSLDNWAMVNNNRTMSQYFRGFEWAEQKFPKGYPLPELCTLIKTKVGKMEEDLKHFQSNYAEQKSAKQAAERSKRGNWQGMELGELLEVQSNAPDSKPTRVEATGKPLSSSDFLDTQFMKVRDIHTVLGLAAPYFFNSKIAFAGLLSTRQHPPILLVVFLFRSLACHAFAQTNTL